jgi:Na+/proline symporter
MAGLMLGALWAAILSSAGGFLNAAATLIGHDVWFKAFKKDNLNDKTKLLYLKIITSAIGVITFFAAWAVPSALRLTLWAGVWLTPPLIPILGATLFDRKGEKINVPWIFISILGSCVAGVVFEAHPSLKGFFSGGTIPAFIVSFILYAAGLLACKGKQHSKPVTA